MAQTLVSKSVLMARCFPSQWISTIITITSLTIGTYLNTFKQNLWLYFFVGKYSICDSEPKKSDFTFVQQNALLNTVVQILNDFPH